MKARDILARNMRRLRKEKAWSQEELAFQSGVHRTYLSGVERSERNIGLDNIEKIAKALRVGIDQLLRK